MSSASTAQATADSNLIPGQYIIVFQDQARGVISEQAATQAVQQTQAVLADHGIAKQSVLFQYKYALKGFAAKLSPRQVNKLRSDPRIKRVTQARMFHVGKTNLARKAQSIAHSSATVLNSSQTTPWGVSRVGGPLDGTGKRAWIIDSGIDLDHPDLNVDVGNSASFIADKTADDNFGHGTYVAGILAAKDNNQDVVGVAAGATVVAIKVCNSSGACPEPGLLNGIDYVGNHAAQGDIVNISIWNTVGIDLNLDDAVTTAANNGVRLVLIAGNAGANANSYSPARVEHSIFGLFLLLNRGIFFLHSPTTAIRRSSTANRVKIYPRCLSAADRALALTGGGRKTAPPTAAPHLASLFRPNRIAQQNDSSTRLYELFPLHSHLGRGRSYPVAGFAALNPVRERYRIRIRH